jgi:hypothetical protein
MKTLLKVAATYLAVALFSSVSMAATLHVEAWIDGRSDLSIQGNTAQWRHYEWDPPGLTTINGTTWNPVGMTTGCGGCNSDVFNGVNPALPALSQTVTLTPISARGSVSIIQQPDAGNGYTLIVRFDDNGPGGAATYSIDLNVPDASPKQIPTMDSIGLVFFAILTAITGLQSLRRQRRN